MNCSEAQEYMAAMWDLSSHDRVTLELNEHLKECPKCALEYSKWEELNVLISETAEFIPEKPLLSMHNNVMDKILKEHLHIQRKDIKSYGWIQTAGHRFFIWISACLTVLMCSIVVTIVKANSSSDETGVQDAAGIVPTGIAASGPDGTLFNQHTRDASGIIEPFVAGIPAYPEYWMFISLLALGMALFSLRRMHHITH